MAITFAYTESTNKVVATEGTSGTPTTFADFVTADRAGSAELLAAEACSVNHTLTYQIRPVEDLALQISFILSGTSAGAGDTLDITGTDWRGAAQSESIDVSGGDDTYTGAKYWRTITDIDCTGWADGTLQVTQPIWGVIWDYGSGQYQVDCDFDIGNGSTTTYWKSVNESVCFNTTDFTQNNSANLQIGEQSNSRGYAGSYWYFKDVSGNPWFRGGNAYTKIYNTFIYVDNAASGLYFNAATLEIRNSIVSGNDRVTQELLFYDQAVSGILRDLHLSNWSRVRFEADLPDDMENVTIHYTKYGVMSRSQVVIKDVLITDTSMADFLAHMAVNNSVTYLNPRMHITTPLIWLASGWGKEAYTCNIHLTDKDGTALASALVDCEYANLVEGSDSKTYKCIADHTAVDVDHKPITGTDWATYWVLYDAGGGLGGDWTTGFDYKSGTAEFSTQTTDADGDITEQTIQYRKWTTTSELLEGRLHKFTLSKAGYETLVLENITVDGPIDWSLELQPMRAQILGRPLRRIQAAQFM